MLSAAPAVLVLFIRARVPESPHFEQSKANPNSLTGQALLTGMAEAALDCIITIDRNGRVVDWNPAAEQTFGYMRDQAVGQEMAALIIPPELRDKHRIGMARFFRGINGSATIRHHWRNSRFLFAPGPSSRCTRKCITIGNGPPIP